MKNAKKTKGRGWWPLLLGAFESHTGKFEPGGGGDYWQKWDKDKDGGGTARHRI